VTCPHGRVSWKICPHCLGWNGTMLVYPCDREGRLLEGPPELLDCVRQFWLGHWVSPG